MTAAKNYKYILRYQIDPTFHTTDRIDELVAYCLKSKIAEVMLFINAEELNTGHITLDELKPYVELAKTLKLHLAAHNISLSLNPWTTLHHSNRGRQLKTNQNFTLMIGETGVQSSITACPLCPIFQKYLSDIFGFLAKQLQPTAIWIEDDWRLHNHGEELNWGGCFCPLHLDRFSKNIVQKVTRQQPLKNILAPGKPHPWRNIWLDLSWDSLLEPAKKLRVSVANASPSVRLGLMSSSPDSHSTEGRNWPALQKAIGNSPAFLTRPHLPPYTETTAIDVPPSVTRQTIACLEPPLQIYPELENSPRSGRYSKSAKFSLWQCFNAVVYGTHGITINHFDMMGNGTALDKDFAKHFAQAKPQLGLAE